MRTKPYNYSMTATKDEDGIELVTLRCICGVLVRGSSLKHCNANIKLHIRSKKHREFMEVKDFKSKENKNVISPVIEKV